MKGVQLPNPDTKDVNQWLKSVQRQQLHDQGWIEVNQRFHGVAFALRPFINQHFDSPEEQEAAFDGATLALLAMAHFDDIDKLARLFLEQKPTKTRKPEQNKRLHPGKLRK